VNPKTATVVEMLPELHRASSFELDGGFTVTHGFGGAVRGSYATHDYPIAVGFSVPDPFNPGTAVDADAFHKARRKEFALDFMANYMSEIAHNWRLRVFGGPTHFSADQDMLGSLRFNEAFPPYSVAVTDLSKHGLNVSAWGYNLGGDLSYFFSTHVGLGGGVHFNRGIVKDIHIPIPQLSNGPLPILVLGPSVPQADLSVGHTTLAAGVRFRY
jgi:hypothetical protein